MTTAIGVAFSIVGLLVLVSSMGMSEPMRSDEIQFSEATKEHFPSSFQQKVKLDPVTISELDQLIEETRRCNNITALSMSILSYYQNATISLSKDLTYAKAFGKKDIDTDSDATNETLFCIGSITKHFTATLLLHVLRLSRNQGYRFDVNETTLAQHLDRSLGFEGSNLRDVTIEDILSHQTGIVETFGPFPMGYPLNMTRAELAQITARSQRIQPNREIFHYNNHVFSQAGYLTEILGGILKGVPVSWESIMREYLLEPLGISQDVEFADQANFSRLATPYFWFKGEPRAADYRVLGALQPAGSAGSICMSSNAMITWMRFLLDKGRFNGQQIVESEDIENTWRPRLSGYGLGWITQEYRGHLVVLHGGYLPPFSSMLILFPKLNISLFTSVSVSNTLDIRALHMQIFDRIMGYESADPNLVGNDPLHPINCKNTSNAIANIAANGTGLNLTLNVTEYIGVYSHLVYGQLKIVSHAGELRMLMGRFGNASIHCEISPNKCRLKMNGILWYLSDSDNAPTPMINFWKVEGEHVHIVSLPWYSSILIEFRWVQSTSVTIAPTFIPPNSTSSGILAETTSGSISSVIGCRSVMLLLHVMVTAVAFL